MPLYIKDEHVDQLARQLTEKIGGSTTKTDAVRIALQNELARHATKEPLRDRVAVIQSRLREKFGPPPENVNIKAIMDDLWEGN